MAKKQDFDYVIVYVFGPEQCENKYYDDELLTRELGEWVKIGETGYKGDINEITPEVMKKAALQRILQESRTGIPVTSKIYDLFIFPYRPKTDDQIRNRLCDDLFDIENSKQINKNIGSDDDKIPAGREFVYGVCRSNIKYAVQSFDHDLIVSTDDPQLISTYITICRLNDINIDDTSNNEDTSTKLVTRKPNLNLDLILEIDDEVVLTNGSGCVIKDTDGTPIKAKFIGNNKIECRGETARTSPLAIKYLNLYGGFSLTNANGNEYWTFQNKKLSSLRKND